MTTSYFDVATAISTGARPYQEDSVISNFALGQSFGYVILADGMGGHVGGDIASALVCAEMFAGLKMRTADIEDGAPHLPLILRHCAQAANARLADFSAQNVNTRGMGATLLAPVFSGNTMSWISVGDSPLWLFRDGALRQLNEDHSMASEIDAMVETGLIDAETGRNHPDRNSLTSVLTGEEIPIIDCPSDAVTVLPGDIVIVASDGLQFLSDTQITDTLAGTAGHPSAAIADVLLNAVLDLDNPMQDNVSFAIVKIADTS